MLHTVAGVYYLFSYLSYKEQWNKAIVCSSCAQPCTLGLHDSSLCCSWAAAFPACPNLSLHDFILILGLLPSGLTHFHTAFTLVRRYSLGYLLTVFWCSGFRICLSFLAVSSICDTFFSDCFTNIRVWFVFFFTYLVCLTHAKTCYYKIWSPIIWQ